MSAMVRAVAIATLALLLAGCGKREIFVEPEPAGRWFYTGYNRNNRVVIRGVMRFEAAHPTDGRFEGAWRLFTVEPIADNRFGPQVGERALSGRLEGSRVSLNLNPDERDDNVWLYGIKDGDVIQGAWQHVGFAGVLNEGTFTAERERRR